MKSKAASKSKASASSKSSASKSSGKSSGKSSNKAPVKAAAKSSEKSKTASKGAAAKAATSKPTSKGPSKAQVVSKTAQKPSAAKNAKASQKADAKSLSAKKPMNQKGIASKAIGKEQAKALGKGKAAATEKGAVAEKADAKALDKKAMKSVSGKTKGPAGTGEVVEKIAKAPQILEEPDTAEDVVLTDAEGRRYCRVKDCDRLAEVNSYCRFHYILLWKNIQTRLHILQEGKLGRYIEELTARYPDKFLEILKKDLRSEKDFMAAIQELEIDESAVEAEFDDEESQSDLFEVQRMSDAGGGGRSDSDEDRF